MKESDKLLLFNKAWAEEKVKADPSFFERLVHIQTPKFLWIGCSDSRVPANEITGTDPGEIFVHRNVANVVVHTDLNITTVIQYAVEVLKVEHIVVCGHYGCGGVRAAMTKKSYGIINKWLRNIKDVYHDHREEIDALVDPEERENRLIEHNVRAQMHNLVKTSLIQRAWKTEGRPWLHAWVYSLKDGVLHELDAVAPNAHIDPVYQYEF